MKSIFIGSTILEKEFNFKIKKEINMNSSFQNSTLSDDTNSSKRSVQFIYFKKCLVYCMEMGKNMKKLKFRGI
jgi:hypothetical protein